MATERIDVVVRETGASRVRRSLNDVGTTAEKSAARVGLLQKSFNDLRTSAVSATGALAGLSAGIAAIAAVRTIANFGDQMATVKSVTLATTEEFQKLNDTARELGATTRFTATEAGQALEQLARAGFDASQSIETVPTVLKLAQAENLTLAESAEIAAKSMRIFRLEIGDIPKVADLLSKAASTATTDVRQLFQALKFGGTIAAGFEFDINETVAALSELADAGQEATLGGTALRGILSRIAAPTKEFKKALGEIGLTIQDINPETNSLVDILTKIGKETTSTSKVFELFRQRAGTGFDVLLKNVDSLRDRVQKLKNEAPGTLDLKFDIKADTLLNDLYTALSAVQELILTLGDLGLAGAMRSVLQVFTFSLRTISQTLQTLEPVIYSVGIALTIAFAPRILFAFEAAILAVTKVFLAFEATVTAFLAANPVTAAFLAIALAIGGTIAFVQQFGNEISVIGTKYATLSDVFTVLGNRISDAFSFVTRNAGLAFDAVLKAGTALANGLLSVFQTMVDAVTAILQGILNTATSIINFIGRRLKLGTVGTLDVGSVDLGGITAPAFITDILKEADVLALERLTFAKEKRVALLDTLHQQNDAEKQLAETKSEANALTAQQNALLTAQKALLQEIQGPQEAAQLKLQALNTLYSSGKIGIDEYTAAMRDLNVEISALDNTVAGGLTSGLARIAQQANDLGKQVSDFVVSAFKRATDAIVEFAKTGKLNFTDLINSILSDLLRLALNQVFAQLAGSFFGTGGTGLGSLLGFQTGGSIIVGGSGGPDSQLVSFLASPGERIDISTPAQQRSGSGGTVINVINNAGADVRQDRRKGADGTEIVDIIMTRVDQGLSSGRFDGAMRGRFGLGTKQTRR